MNARPVRVHARLVTPIVLPARALHLDALLAAASVEAELDAGNPDALAAQDCLPLARAGHPEAPAAWCWKASALHFSFVGEVHQFFTVRRTDVNDYALDHAAGVVRSRKTILAQGSGAMKDYFFSTPMRLATEVEAWAVGDPVEIARLLAGVSHLGRMRRNDFGRVAGWDVREDARADRAWARRALPEALAAEAESAADYARAVGGWRPPYWDRTRWAQIREWVPAETGAPEVPAAA